MNIFLLTLLFITAAPYAGADTIFNEKMSFNTAKAVKLGRGGGTSGWTNATIVTATRAVDADKTCMAHCAACNTKTGQCSKCEDGYWMEGGSCNLCSDFLENCAVCDASGSTCTKCFDGYKMTGGSCTGGSCEDGYWWDDWELACFACPADCKTCSDDATCESCFDGYYHDMDRCVPCSQNCKQCNYNGCTQCESGYELNNGKCSQASCSIPNCLSCSGNTCLQCGANSELYNGACCAIGGTCKTWENSDECLCAECYPLYELTSEKLCVECTKETPENCAEASIYCGKCYTCKDGYSLTAEGQCVKTTMPEHCKTYDGTKCTQCDTGYGLDSNNKCEKYPDLGCETYQWTADGFECASCSGTQKLAYNICKDELRVCVEDYDDVCFTQEYK